MKNWNLWVTRPSLMLLASILLCSCVASSDSLSKANEGFNELDSVTTTLSKAQFPTLNEIKRILPVAINDTGEEHAYATEGVIHQVEVITYRSVQTGNVERLNLLVDKERRCFSMKEAIDRWGLGAINVRPVLSESMGSIERTITSFSGKMNNAAVTAQSSGKNGSCIDKVIVDYSGKGPL